MSEINGSKTPLQLAQERLLGASMNIDPRSMLPTAYVNGVLLAARLNALIDCVGCGDPRFQQAFDAALLAQMEKLSGSIETQNAQPKIQIASAGH
jgi:hypothetical protein